jgi:UDP-glucose 4-epimerase
LTLNEGTGKGISVLEMIDEVKKASGRDFAVKFGPRRPAIRHHCATPPNR